MSGVVEESGKIAPEVYTLKPAGSPVASTEIIGAITNYFTRGVFSLAQFKHHASAFGRAVYQFSIVCRSCAKEFQLVDIFESECAEVGSDTFATQPTI